MATSLTQKMTPGGGRRGPTGLAPPALLADNDSYEEPWDEGERGVLRARSAGSGYSAEGLEVGSAGGSPTYTASGRRGRSPAGPVITSTAGGNPTAATTAAAAAALAAAEGGPAAPSADIGIEVSPTGRGGSSRQALEDADDAALRSRSPFLACVDDASAAFRERVNCDWEARENQAAEENGDLPSLSIPAHRKGGSQSPQREQQTQAEMKKQVGGRVVTVGGKTAVTTTRSLSPPSKKGVRGIIDESMEKAEPPSPLGQRKQEAFFNQFDDDDDDSANGPQGRRSRDEGDDGSDYASKDDSMPDDELNDSRSAPVGTSAANQQRGSNDAPGGAGSLGSEPQRRHLDEGIEVEEQEGVMSGLVRAMSDICSLDGSKKDGGGSSSRAAPASAGAPSAATVPGRATGDEEAIVADHPGFDLDICAYLHNVCGDPAVTDDGPPPPPPPLPGTQQRGGSGSADDDEGEINTSINGKAAQLRLPSSPAVNGGHGVGAAPIKTTDQQENTAIEVEYVDPDMYSSDEEEGVGDGAKVPGGKKKKKKGLGLGLGKMFGKSKKKVQQDRSTPSQAVKTDAGKETDASDAKEGVAAAAAATAAAAAAVGTAAAVSRSSGPQEPPQYDQRAVMRDDDDDDDDESQQTADRFEDSDGESAAGPQIVSIPGDGEEAYAGVADYDEVSEAISSTSGSANRNASKKNAYLEAMAARAKDDYRRSAANSPHRVDEASAADEGDDVADDASVPEDDYAEWRPSEKRRFLQLLSSGMTPRQAARTIKNARSQKDAEGGESSFESKEGVAAAEERTTEAAAGYAPTSPTQEASQGTDIAPDEDTALETTALSLSEADKEHKADKIAIAAAVAAGAATAAIASSRDESSSQEQVEKDRDVDATAAGPDKSGSLVPESALALVPKEEEDAVAAAAAALALAPKEEEDVPADKLTPTGLNYYDAVRRDDPRDFDDANVNDTSMNSSASFNKSQESTKSKRSITPFSLKAKGFESLDKVPPEEDKASEVLSDQSHKKSNFMGLPSKLRPGKRGKEGFSSLPSDDDDEPPDDGDSPTANARNLRRARKAVADGNHGAADDDTDDKSVGEHSASSASLSAAIMMLRKKTTGFQRMPSEKEDVIKEDVDEDGDDTPATITQTHDVHQAEDNDQHKPSERVADEEKKEQPEADDKDDDSLFDFEEDDTVAVGAKAAKPQPGADGDGDVAPTFSSDMDVSVVSGLTMNTLNVEDSMSVGTMDRSVLTAATSASTKSTRRRHRGAAKNRLSKAKEAEGSVPPNNVGWLDSIRAAAANNNRKWDPQLGWVDYTEPESAQSNVLNGAGAAKRIGPLPLADKVRKHNEAHSGDESEVQSTSRSVVPFPSEWEKERDAMIEESFDANVSEEVNESDESPVNEDKSPVITEEAPSIGEEPVSVNEKSRLIGDDSQVNTSASSVPLVVIPEQNDRSMDEHTVESGLTTQSGWRSHEGAAHRRVGQEKSKPVGWHQSMKAAAASVSAQDPNKRWDPKHGWEGLPPEAMPASQEPDTAHQDLDKVIEEGYESIKAAAASVGGQDPNRRGDHERGSVGLTPEPTPANQEPDKSHQELDKVIEEVVSAGGVGTRSAQVERDSSIETSALNDSRDSRRSGPVDVDEVSEDEGESDQDEKDDEDGAQKVEVGGVDEANPDVNVSRVSSRSGPVDLDESDFEDSSDEDDARDGSRTLGARDVLVSQQEPQQSQDGTSAQDKSRDGLYHFIENSSPEMKSSADGASDDAVGSARKEPNQSQSTVKPSKLDFSKLPRIGRTPEAMQGYDELASVESERQYVAEDSPRLTSSNKVERDKSNVVVTAHREVHYEQFSWERTVTSDAANAKEEDVAPQSSVDEEVVVEEGEAQAIPTEHSEKSTREVQVIKLKMSEKDKDLFNTNDASVNYIDDTNFAPDFADESPFGTPSRRSKSQGIEADGAKLGGPSWDDDANGDASSSRKGTESADEVKDRPPESKFLQMQQERRRKELDDDAPDPPSSVPDPPAADFASKAAEGSADANLPGVVLASNEGSVMSANTGLDGEDISLKTGESSQREGPSISSRGPSVSSRAKQWMDLMEAKSKSRLPVKSDRALEEGARSPKKVVGSPQHQAEEGEDTDDLETKSKASSSVEWPGASGAAAGRSQKAGTEEWKSFLGKKAQAETTAQKPRGLVFSAADEASETHVSSVEVSGAGAGKARSVASSGTEDDSIFKFDGKYDAAESTQLKAELEKMSSSKQQRSQRSAESTRLKAELEKTSSSKQQRSERSAPSDYSDGRDDSAQKDVNRTQDGEKGEKIDKSTFFQRLSACAAPILPRTVNDASEEVPASHLDFMRNASCPTDGSQKLLKKLPPAMCGRPDTIFEEGKDKERQESMSRDDYAQRSPVSPSQRRKTSRSRPSSDSEQTPRSRSSHGEGFSEVRASTSSVASGDGFGAKTAYLEAVALRAATKKSKKKGGRSSSSVASSSASSSRSSKPSSEAWQSFVEKRASKDANTSGDSAELKAAKKVEDMMAAMSRAAVSKDEIDDMIDTMSQSSPNSSTSKPRVADPVERTRSSGSWSTKKSETAKAAEELAAARVEAMMAAMSSAKLDNEGEI